MTETQNVQTVKNCFAAYMRGDLETILQNTTEDVQWTMPGEGYIPSGGVYGGRDGVRSFFQKLKDTSETLDFEAREFLAQGDLLVVLGSYRGRARNTGQLTSSDWVMSFTFRDGKIARFQEYADTAVMAAAFGAMAKAA